MLGSNQSRHKAHNITTPNYITNSFKLVVSENFFMNEGLRKYSMAPLFAINESTLKRRGDVVMFLFGKAYLTPLNHTLLCI